MSNRYLLIAVALAALLPATSALSWGSDDYSVCKLTAKTMLRACRYDVRDDYYETLANCQNLSGWADRWACFGDAHATKAEDGESCGDVLEARIEACDVLDEDRYDPDPLLANAFIHPDQVPDEYPVNPYISVVAGHTYVLHAGEEGEEIVVVHVTEDTREILGVECRVVVDIVVEESMEEGESNMRLLKLQTTGSLKPLTVMLSIAVKSPATMKMAYFEIWMVPLRRVSTLPNPVT